MLSPINVEYDPSNGSWNIWCIEIAGFGVKATEVWELQPFWFATLGQAMSFLQPQIARPLAQDSPGGMWTAALKSRSAFKGHAVRIQQLILVQHETLPK